MRYRGVCGRVSALLVDSVVCVHVSERGQNVATKSCGAIAEKEHVKIRTFGGAADCVCLQTCLFEIEEPCTVHHPEN